VQKAKDFLVIEELVDEASALMRLDLNVDGLAFGREMLSIRRDVQVIGSSLGSFHRGITLT